jgi:hypothetical protein
VTRGHVHSLIHVEEAALAGVACSKSMQRSAAGVMAAGCCWEAALDGGWHLSYVGVDRGGLSPVHDSGSSSVVASECCTTCQHALLGVSLYMLLAWRAAPP